MKSKAIYIRPMKFDDINQVYKLECELFPNPWPRWFFENDLQINDTIAYVAMNNIEIVGYALGRCVSDELHITNIAVDKKYQRQGIARMMMQKLEETAKTKGCLYAYLEVRVNNEAAINLYKKFGYKILYTRANYYLDGADAYVMDKELIQQKEVL